MKWKRDSARRITNDVTFVTDDIDTLILVSKDEQGYYANLSVVVNDLALSAHSMTQAKDKALSAAIKMYEKRLAKLRKFQADELKSTTP